jgi:sulfoxide reductase heme-binding subunit YedZ
LIKFSKAFVFILCLWPLGTIILDIYYNQLGAEPVKKIMNHFGEWTLIFICLTLTMSPLKRITNLSVWIKFRRMLGLFVFFYATIHLLTYVGLDYRFDWQPIFNDVLKKKYIFIGFSAWLLLIPLAVTSSQKMIKLLRHNWKNLHRIVYVVAIFGSLHYIWLSKTIFFKPLIYAIIIVVLLALRIKIKNRGIKYGRK